MKINRRLIALRWNWQRPHCMVPDAHTSCTREGIEAAVCARRWEQVFRAMSLRSLFTFVANHVFLLCSSKKKIWFVRKTRFNSYFNLNSPLDAGATVSAGRVCASDHRCYGQFPWTATRSVEVKLWKEMHEAMKLKVHRSLSLSRIDDWICSYGLHAFLSCWLSLRNIVEKKRHRIDNFTDSQFRGYCKHGHSQVWMLTMWMWWVQASSSIFEFSKSYEPPCVRFQCTRTIIRLLDSAKALHFQIQRLRVKSWKKKLNETENLRFIQFKA